MANGMLLIMVNGGESWRIKANHHDFYNELIMVAGGMLAGEEAVDNSG